MEFIDKNTLNTSRAFFWACFESSTPHLYSKVLILLRKHKKSGTVLPIPLIWGVEDSNLRRLSQQIYSLPHLTTLETPRMLNFFVCSTTAKSTAVDRAASRN